MIMANFPPLEEEVVQRPDRPLGVILITIWDGIFFGIIPILSTVFGLLRGGLEDTLPFTIYLNAFISILVITAAIGAFAGSDRSRSALIYIITVYQSLGAFNSVILLASGTLPPADQVFAVGRIFSSLFWIALHIWYFLKPSTIEYYRKPKNK